MDGTYFDRGLETRPWADVSAAVGGLWEHARMRGCLFPRERQIAG